jgi:hypothetical protein
MEVSNQQLARTITQKDHLKTLEEIIAKSENAFYETGSALREIREQKLYPGMFFVYLYWSLLFPLSPSSKLPAFTEVV